MDSIGDLDRFQNISREEYLLRKKKYVYETLDKQDFGRFHVKAVIITGIGFLTDMYDLFAINLVMMMMTQVYCSPSQTNMKPWQMYCPASNQSEFLCGNNNNTNSASDSPLSMNLPGIIDTSVKASGIIGVIFGQIVFGILGDRLGRTRMYGLVLAIMIVGTFTSSFAASTVSGLNVFGVLIIWRIVLGIGIGGDFPLSAIITSEYANKRYRGAMIAGVFSMQGAGILAQGFVTLISLVAFKGAIQRDESNLDYVWRIALGMGTLPGLLAIFWRLNLPETPRYTLEVDNDYERAAIDVDFVFNPKLKRNISVKRVGENRPSVKDLVMFFKRKRNFKLLLGTSIPRFALNVAFYGINLNSSIILHSIGFGVSNDIYTTIFNNAVGQVVIALLGSIPGYMLSIVLIEKIGRRNLQIQGFAVLTVIFIILGCIFNQIRCTSMWLFIGIFTLAQLICNAGPNTTVFVIPAEVFPTRIRSTTYGFSAAFGKLGAAISEIGFFQLKDYYGTTNSGIPLIIQIFAGFMFIGFVFSFFLPETKNRSLEEISKEYDKEEDIFMNDSLDMGEISVIKVDND